MKTIRPLFSIVLGIFTLSFYLTTRALAEDGIGDAPGLDFQIETTPGNEGVTSGSICLPVNLRTPLNPDLGAGGIAGQKDTPRISPSAPNTSGTKELQLPISAARERMGPTPTMAPVGPNSKNASQEEATQAPSPDNDPKASTPGREAAGGPKNGGDNLEDGSAANAKAFDGNTDKAPELSHVSLTFKPKVTPEERRLVERAKAGDERAFETLYKQNRGRLFRTARRITGNDADAEDGVSDAFFKAYKNLNRFNGDSQFSTWVTRILVNEILQEQRKHKRVVVSLDEPIEQEDNDEMHWDLRDNRRTQEAEAINNELGNRLGKAIESLPPMYRTVFVLREVDGMSIEETAAALGIKVNTTKARLLRARAALRIKLAARGYGPREGAKVPAKRKSRARAAVAAKASGI